MVGLGRCGCASLLIAAAHDGYSSSWAHATEGIQIAEVMARTLPAPGVPTLSLTPPLLLSLACVLSTASLLHQHGTPWFAADRHIPTAPCRSR
jgi:hypothetical protein